ncbi:hypothetical protein DPSP01_014199 [Paraphaeosphaeria sporulosa]|uniref:Putative oxidoreductase,short chain dehydrogenase n=1 Tax=Paraphaeosphaeria sporulosa TaxID=1460663 RepID=A0A177CQN0_9PLEO|nr:putative oxidoreductase,short chain dehydrogenase [Paraphaeosphaeria sporulosa]OAG09079.1 putative oxidoreductase,short chain dehydrogenase [Paraphaeosphaeria sporulosa]
MTEVQIEDEDFASLRNQAVVITGGSSGIGLATVKLLLDNGALVAVGDVNEPPLQHPNLIFQKTNIASWGELSALFKSAKSNYGRVDHVFANAGISGRTTYLEENFDANGELLEPDDLVNQINLKGCANTCALAIHYMRRQETGGSIVVTASASSFQRFRLVDYTMAKHGVLGLIRGLQPLLHPQLPIRINGISPSWTATGLAPKEFIEMVIPTQTPAVVARSVALLMADEMRHGQLIYSVQGKFSEIEESVLLPAAKTIVGDISEDLVLTKVQAAAANLGLTKN